MTLLVLCASALVLGGLLWALQRLVARPTDEMCWPQLLVVTAFLIASSMLMVYLTW
jgi:hypothetical protein